MDQARTVRPTLGGPVIGEDLPHRPCFWIRWPTLLLLWIMLSRLSWVVRHSLHAATRAS